MTWWQWIVAALAGITVWTVAIAAPLGVLAGRVIRRREQREEPIDLLAGLPVDVLAQPEIDALFVRLVAPLDRERQS